MSIEKTTAIGNFLITCGKLDDDGIKGGKQALQKIVGKTIFYKSGKSWFYNVKKIKSLTIKELNYLSEQINFIHSLGYENYYYFMTKPNKSPNNSDTSIYDTTCSGRLLNLLKSNQTKLGIIMNGETKVKDIDGLSMKVFLSCMNAGPALLNELKLLCFYYGINLSE